jgi:hypothetical protein
MVDHRSSKSPAFCRTAKLAGGQTQATIQCTGVQGDNIHELLQAALHWKVGRIQVGQATTKSPLASGWRLRS